MIQFICDHQNLSLKGKPFVVGDSIRYLEVSVDFTSDWDRCVKYMYFWQDGNNPKRYILDDDKIPARMNLDLTDGEWNVCIFGYDGYIDEATASRLEELGLPLPTKHRISTNIALLEVESAGPFAEEILN